MDLGQAKELLNIAITASRSLTPGEMNIALVVHPGLAGLKDLFLQLKHAFENYVESLCRHVIRIIRNSVLLVHQTAREFLRPRASAAQTTLPIGRWEQSVSLPRANLVLLNACVEYFILFSPRDTQKTQSKLFKAGLIVIQVSDFFEYAAQY